MTVCLHLPFFFVHTNCIDRYKLSFFSTAIFFAGLTPFFGHALAAGLSPPVEPKKRAEQVVPVTKKITSTNCQRIKNQKGIEFNSLTPTCFESYRSETP